MRSRRFNNLLAAFWLGIVALAASAFEQQQLGLTTLTAAGVTTRSAFAVPSGYHLMPDGTLMAGTMHGATPAEPLRSGGEPGQTSHDCDACIAIAAMGALTVAALPEVVAPPSVSESSAARPVVAILRARNHPAYASRAPPVALI